MTRLALLLLVPLLLAGALVAPAQARAASPAAAYASTAHAATNAARAKQGLKPLTRSSCLKTYAAAQAARIAASGELVHQDLALVLAGCGLSGAGENLALGFGNGRAVVRGWMHSPPHRANILTASFRSEAIAAARGADGRWYVAQVFGR